MADKNHLKRLLKGSIEWNNWRDSNSNIIPDLSNATLTNINLGDVNLKNAILCGADFRGATLSDEFKGVVKLAFANLHKAILREIRLVGVVFEGADLSEADLSRSNLDHAIFTGANLYKADLTLANLISADLFIANLSEANLSYTNFLKAWLGQTNLSKANLYSTNLNLAFLSGSDFTNAKIKYANFSCNDLSEIIGLDSVIHEGPSSIGIDTLFKSQGKIPDKFLIGCGVPQSVIDYNRSLIESEQVIQFYSCFISYSHKDEEFAHKLCSSLRKENIRVWYAPENIKGGQKLHEQIEDAIYLYDRLLVVLSENSFQSEWVMTEIRKACKKEKKENKRKLFPISITDFDNVKEWECFDADLGKDLAVEIREYFIPDFSNWKNHTAFELALKRLVQDLKESDVSKK